MRYKTKLVLAMAFVLAVGAAATAFGQAGGGSGRPAQKPGNPPQGEGRKVAECSRHWGQQKRAAKRLVHSDTKIQVRDGFAVVTVDRGVITSVDPTAKTLSIKRADGETVTVTARDATRICRDGKPATFSELQVGDKAGILQAEFQGKRVVRRIVALSEQVRSAEGSGQAPARMMEGPDLAELDLAV